MDLKWRNQAREADEGAAVFVFERLDATPKRGGAPKAELIMRVQAELRLWVTQLFTGETRGVDELPAHPRSSLPAEEEEEEAVVSSKIKRGERKKKKNAPC